MGRILSIDYGMKRTGIAVSDPLRIIATALETVPTHTLMKWLEDYFKKEAVDIVVLGLPRRLNGEASATLPHVEGFAKRFRAAYPDKKLEMYDERFTSVLANRVIRESGIGKMARRDKTLVDKVSATIILQDYMSTL